MARRVRVVDTTNRIHAVKLVREMTGFGLKESLDHVDGKAWFSVDREDPSLAQFVEEGARAGVTFELDPPFGAAAASSGFELPVAIGVAGDHAIRYRSGPNKIGAIKLTREINPSLGLKDAKDLVEGQGLIRVGVSSSEAQRIVRLFLAIDSVVTVEEGTSSASSLPPPSVPPPSAAPPASGRTAAFAKPAHPATHVYGRPDDNDDF